MRHVTFLLALTLAASSYVSNNRPAFTDAGGTTNPLARSSIESTDVVVPDPLTLFKPEALSIKDREFITAYRDGFTILSADNNCSRFYGGTVDPLKVFNQMLAKFSKSYIDAKTGIKMTGGYSNFLNSMNGFSYRLFAKGIINQWGAFYKEKRFTSEAFVPGVGSFSANTRKARVLMLLHELAHLIRGTNGRWLIPDDGFDYEQSRRNTDTVEKQCGEYIQKLG
ncbi:MAG: hypothetical protein DMF68_05230 [Acidobacteria bacterium]|nr:MAG: hypothetical protein DMF68_05230 [Acidobacteriota bacterium]